MGNLLDRLASSEAFDEHRDLAVSSAFKGFTSIHTAVGTSDLTDEVASFWFYDTSEILSFWKLMCIYAAVYTIQFWSYIGHMRWGYQNAGQTISSTNSEQRLALTHLASLCCGWVVWFGIFILVALRQWWDSNSDDSSTSPKLVTRGAPSVWAPVPHRQGVFQHPIQTTGTQPWRFSSPITGVDDGNALYSHDSLVGKIVFGDKVHPKLRKERKRWKVRLKNWIPPSFEDALGWMFSQRLLVQDFEGRMGDPKPLPGRYFVDYDEAPRHYDMMRGKMLRRIVWILMWLPCGIAGICELIRYWLFLKPQTSISWITFAISFVSAIVILWLQISIWGAKLLESYDREAEESENVFSPTGARTN